MFAVKEYEKLLERMERQSLHERHEARRAWVDTIVKTLRLVISSLKGEGNER
jgi:hypothetical protein